MHWFYLIIASLAPIFASPMIGGIPTTPALRIEYIEQYLYFLLPLTTWSITLFATLHFLSKDISQFSLKALITFMPLFCCLLLALSALQLFRIHFSEGQFYFLIATLSFQSAAIALLNRNRQVLALLILSLNSWLLGYFTFTLLGLHLNWQALLFTAGIAAQCLSLRLSLLFAGEPPTLLMRLDPSSKLRKQNYNLSTPILRVYLVSLVAGVACLALLVLLGHLHSLYFSIYLLLLPIVRLANKVRAGNSFLPANAMDTGQILAGYILIVTLVAQFIQ